MSDSRPVYPPVYFLGALLSEIVLHFAWPWHGVIEQPYTFGGIALIVAGVSMMVWAACAFAKAGTTIKPFAESSALVTRALYRFSRNPMYLSMVTILLGTALLLGSASPFFVLPVFVVAIQTRFIHREEADLLAKFGKDYDAYRSKVRRWI